MATDDDVTPTGVMFVKFAPVTSSDSQ